MRYAAENGSGKRLGRTNAVPMVDGVSLWRPSDACGSSDGTMQSRSQRVVVRKRCRHSSGDRNRTSSFRIATIYENRGVGVFSMTSEFASIDI